MHSLNFYIQMLCSKHQIRITASSAKGIEAILKFLQDWTAIIPDDKATFLTSRRVGNDQVVCKVVWSGIHSGKSFE